VRKASSSSLSLLVGGNKSKRSFPESARSRHHNIASDPAAIIGCGIYQRRTISQHLGILLKLRSFGSRFDVAMSTVIIDMTATIDSNRNFDIGNFIKRI
jgi:hypothetical protein